MAQRKSTKTIIRDLGDGLILRRATPADMEELIAFNVRIHSVNNPDEAGYIEHETREWMSGDHFSVKPRDFTVVEDTRTSKIVSSLNLISQTWSYAGIRFGLGQPEMVGTDPDYRRRGLIRAQFEVIHEWSAQRGELAQVIGGIPFFYRQFGYEMTLPCNTWLGGHKSQVPKLKEGEQEPYRLRPATEADVPFITRTYQSGMGRYLVACVRPAAVWRYELTKRPRQGNIRAELRVVETSDGKRVGMLAHASNLAWDALAVRAYELRAGVSWLVVTPSVLRYLAKIGEEYASRDTRGFEQIRFFQFDTKHPVFDALGNMLRPRPDSYAFYVRVPDLVGFLRHIAPALEQRLADSVAVGHTGELTISFYGKAIRMAFAKGKLARIEQIARVENASASFPNLTFLHLLLGHRSLDEVSHMYGDCWVSNQEAAALVNILFPKQSSYTWFVM